ncbi:hypothetical protein ZI88_11505 [Salmonella enterica subsp. enterica serovar Newport]|uniref:hypothetical protein n=1 Tax=Citrobacter freundii complex TaxID=1344959 RepID=UPI0012843BB2|nr:MULTISPECIES: hypothetical protein [Citrobacter]EBF8324280.1 hypothetical protein [Salmonella enterica]ECJ3532102.1 hypothetical protein [Salmonella enterica subsp. enterica serovar Newport]ECM2260644.1 hypothetical protein [Salmonella enterica subsp. enterica serovar Newport]ECN7844767.1 hypothetical protein [Salmonella enterica subsp. enterica serovar Newport]MDE9718859.1 hypothetical protein [Citrobacter cronae]
MKKIFIFAISLILAGCASTKNVDVVATEKAQGDRIIAINSARSPWVYEIEKRLKQKGFTVLRSASQQVTIEKQTNSTTGIYNEATTRYVLNLNGFAPNNTMTRCYGGGYDFEYIDAELIDVKNNQTMFHYSNSGFSENCPPMSGTIFTDITNLVANAW